MSIIISLACALSVAGLGNECWSIENCPLFYVGSFGDEAPTWLQAKGDSCCEASVAFRYEAGSKVSHPMEAMDEVLLLTLVVSRNFPGTGL